MCFKSVSYSSPRQSGPHPCIAGGASGSLASPWPSKFFSSKLFHGLAWTPPRPLVSENWLIDLPSKFDICCGPILSISGRTQHMLQLSVSLPAFPLQDQPHRTASTEPTPLCPWDSQLQILHTSCAKTEHNLHTESIPQETHSSSSGCGTSDTHLAQQNAPNDRAASLSPLYSAWFHASRAAPSFGHGL